MFCKYFKTPIYTQIKLNFRDRNIIRIKLRGCKIMRRFQLVTISGIYKINSLTLWIVI